MKAVTSLNRIWQGFEPFKENAFVMIEACSYFWQNLFKFDGILELCGHIHGAATHLWEDLWLQLFGIIKGNVKDKYNGITLVYLTYLKNIFKEVKIHQQLLMKTILYLFLLHLQRRLHAHLSMLVLLYLHLWETYTQEVNYTHQTWWHKWANVPQEPAISGVIHLWFVLPIHLPLWRTLTSKPWKTDWKSLLPKSWKLWPKTSKHHGLQQHAVHKWTLPRCQAHLPRQDCSVVPLLNLQIQVMININQLQILVAVPLSSQLYPSRQNLHYLHKQFSQLYINSMDYIVETHHHNVQLCLEEEQQLDHGKHNKSDVDQEVLHTDHHVATLQDKAQTIDKPSQHPHQNENLLWQFTEPHHPAQETSITLFMQDQLWWEEDHHYQGLLNSKAFQIPHAPIQTEYYKWTFWTSTWLKYPSQSQTNKDKVEIWYSTTRTWTTSEFGWTIWNANTKLYWHSFDRLEPAFSWTSRSRPRWW